MVANAGELRSSRGADFSHAATAASPSAAPSAAVGVLLAESDSEASNAPSPSISFDSLVICLRPTSEPFMLNSCHPNTLPASHKLMRTDFYRKTYRLTSREYGPSLAINSSCVPDSWITPSASTHILFASLTVLRRCATRHMVESLVAISASRACKS